MKRIVLHILAIWSIGALLAWPAMLLAGLLSDLGWLGSCFEGGCGYLAVFFVFPAIWIVLTGVAAALWFRWWRRRSETLD